jgi:hypothetical protein
LAWLAREGTSALARAFWDDPTTQQASKTVLKAVEVARRFSLHVEGPPLLYNLLLAERRHEAQGTDAELIENYRMALDDWARRESAEATFQPSELWQFLVKNGGRLIEPQRRFVESWANRVVEIGPERVIDDDFLRRLVERRELQLKGKRARLANKGRLLDWSGRVGVGRMDFRWFRVRQLLMDLHQGLGR